jgi:hypothetical protein
MQTILYSKVPPTPMFLQCTAIIEAVAAVAVVVAVTGGIPL